MIEQLAEILKGGDLRSIGRANQLIVIVKNQQDFDQLFQFLLSGERVQAMRAADAIEKITVNHPEYLKTHKKELLALLPTAVNKEMKWHLCQLIPRLSLSVKELTRCLQILTEWVFEKKESKIVRVNALQALFDLQQKYPGGKINLQPIIARLEKENTASIKARLRKIQKGQ
jgi:hypothetical protein